MAQQYGNGGGITVQMEGPFGGGGAAVKLINIPLPASAWKGGESPYFQEVEVDEVSINSMIFLSPTAEQHEHLCSTRTAITTKNEAGVITAFATGNKPTEDYVFQATLMEVIA